MPRAGASFAAAGAAPAACPPPHWGCWCCCGRGGGCLEHGIGSGRARSDQTRRISYTHSHSKASNRHVPRVVPLLLLLGRLPSRPRSCCLGLLLLRLLGLGRRLRPARRRGRRHQPRQPLRRPHCWCWRCRCPSGLPPRGRRRRRRCRWNKAKGPRRRRGQGGEQQEEQAAAAGGPDDHGCPRCCSNRAWLLLVMLHWWWWPVGKSRVYLR